MSKVKKIQMPSGTTLDLPDGFDWIGTKAEYDAAWAAGTIKSDWICMITDDTADNPSRANVSLTNLDSVGEARLAEKANVDLSNLSDTGSKMMDGQWVAKTQTLSTATAVGTYTIDLSDYLPNDNYNYEIFVACDIGRNDGGYGNTNYYVASYFIDEKDRNFIRLTLQGCLTDSGKEDPVAYRTTGKVIVGQNRKVSVAITNTACSTASCVVWYYRRLGTNP